MKYVIWKNIVQLGRPQMYPYVSSMRNAYWTHKDTKTVSEYAMLTAFPLQRWLHELTSVLRHTYIACLVILVTTNGRGVKKRATGNPAPDGAQRSASVPSLLTHEKEPQYPLSKSMGGDRHQYGC
jgi:hypothetical protein